MSYITLHMKLFQIRFLQHTGNIIRHVKFQSYLTCKKIKFKIGMGIYEIGKRIGRMPRSAFPLKVRLAIIKIEHRVCLLGIRIC